MRDGRSGDTTALALAIAQPLSQSYASSLSRYAPAPSRREPLNYNILIRLLTFPLIG